MAWFVEEVVDMERELWRMYKKAIDALLWWMMWGKECGMNVGDGGIFV